MVLDYNTKLLGNLFSFCYQAVTHGWYMTTSYIIHKTIKCENSQQSMCHPHVKKILQIVTYVHMSATLTYSKPEVSCLLGNDAIWSGKWFIQEHSITFQNTRVSTTPLQKTQISHLKKLIETAKETNVHIQCEKFHNSLSNYIPLL